MTPSTHTPLHQQAAALWVPPLSALLLGKQVTASALETALSFLSAALFSFGQCREEINTSGLSKKAVVVFASDN